MIHQRRNRRTWQLQEAKARFSELVNEVVISCEEFEKLKKPKNTLGEFFSESPFSVFDLEVKRDKDFGTCILSKKKKSTNNLSLENLNQ